MSVQVMVPTALRRFTNEQATISAGGQTVAEVLGTVVSEHGALKNHLYTEDGKLRTFVNIYLNNEDIRYLQKEQTPVKEGDVLMIVPSIAGGVEISHSPAYRGLGKLSGGV